MFLGHTNSRYIFFYIGLLSSFVYTKQSRFFSDLDLLDRIGWQTVAMATTIRQTEHPLGKRHKRRQWVHNITCRRHLPTNAKELNGSETALPLFFYPRHFRFDPFRFHIYSRKSNILIIITSEICKPFFK